LFQFHFTVEGIEINEIETINEIISGEVDGLIIDKQECKEKISYTITKEKEKVFIIFYNTGKTLIQGKPLNLFNMFSTYITQLLSIEEIVPVLNEYYNVDIKNEQIDVQVLEFIPNIKEFHSSQFEASLYQSIYNLNLFGKMYDYTYLLHPVLRAMDGHLRFIMKKYKVDMKDNFDMFECNIYKVYKLKDNFKKNFGSPKKISYVTKLYNYYKKHRHSLFHWDTPIGKVDNTRMVTSKAEVDRIIKESLNLINEYYIVK